MAYLGKYIRQILSKQERVILPGFGSLIFVKSGGVSTIDRKLDPHGTIIKFDAEHPKDDGRLASEYAAGENIDLEEAGQQVLELVDAIKFKLEKGEPFSLDLVGVFTRDDDNRIDFKKDPNWIIDPDLFGLPSLDLLELEEEEPEKETVETMQEPSRKETVAVKKEPVPIKKKMANRAPVNKWKIIWIIVGSLIVVLVLILLIPSDSNIEFSKEGIVLKENVLGDEKHETLKESNQLVTGGQHTKEQQNEVVREIEKPVEVKTSNNFFIIAGSFQELQNATELMESLKAEGFPSEIIITESRLYRVSVKSYPEKQQAINELKSIKSHPGLGSCWVWTRQP